MKPYSIELKDAFKQYTLDQDKTISPEKTVAQFKKRLQELDLDILEKTERIDKGRLDIPVFFSRCGADARLVIGTTKQMGKGGSPTQAEASAVMELAERYSFFSFCNDGTRFILDTFANLHADALSFESIEKSVHDVGGNREVKRQLFDSLPLKWTWAFSLTTRRPVLVPFDWFFSINEFNGPSAGNCTEEAILQGICEVVERHVCSIVSRDRRAVPGIRAASATDPMVTAMLAKYDHAGIDLYLSDFTLDMGIPSVGVMACDPSTFPEKSEIVWTAGTTPDPQKALSRALTETAQLGGDFNTDANYVASGLPKLSHLDEARFITHPQHTIDINNLPDLSSDNIKSEIENCVAALADNDLEVLVIDTMHSRLRVPAFYTIVPGAHFRERTQDTSIGMICAKLIRQNQPPQKAIKALGDMRKLLPQTTYLPFYIGLCRLDMGDEASALSSFQSALSRDPETGEAATIYSYMGVCLKNMQEYEQALEVLAKGEALDNQRTDIHNLMGFCHYKLKQHNQAIERFARVLELDPGSAIDYANIASNYREMGDLQKAAVFYEIALSIDPDIDFAKQSLNRIRNADANHSAPKSA